MSENLPAETEAVTTFFETDDDGRVQEVCMLTGDILRKAPSALDLLENKNVEKVPHASKLAVWKYHTIYGQIIAEMISTGKTITEISEMPGMPKRHVIGRWEVKHEEFREMLQAARKIRAEGYADEIVRDAEGDHMAEKDQVQQRRLKLDRLKWAASKGDPEKYGDRTKVSGDSDAPLQIVVSTGIIRKPKE